MKPKLTALALLISALTLLGGCVVVPADYYGHGYYYEHPHRDRNRDYRGDGNG